MENTKLDFLHRATGTMSADQRASVYDYLLGWLSNVTPTEIWNEAVAAAVDFTLNRPARKAARQ